MRISIIIIVNSSNLPYLRTQNDLSYLYFRTLQISLKDPCTTLAKFDFVEVNTETQKEVNATMRIDKYDKKSKNNITFITYHGKSTRPLKMTGQPKNEKEIMEKEAKKTALIEFFKERFGFSKFDDWYVDELGRPIEIE